MRAYGGTKQLDDACAPVCFDGVNCNVANAVLDAAY